MLPADYSSLYDRSVLEHWHPIMQEGILNLYTNTIVKYLRPEERARLTQVQFEFPFYVPEKSELFLFSASNNRICVPILSMRFFGDLALASSWLTLKGYNTMTVLEYVGMIQIDKKFPNGKFPRPLEALQIPEQLARRDPQVMQRQGDSYTEAMIFILCHEVAHVMYRHPGYDPAHYAEARAHELQADQFALEMSRRMGYMPLGIAEWLLFASVAETSRGEFRSSQEWEAYLAQRTHPLFGERLQWLVSTFRESGPDFLRNQKDRAAGEQVIDVLTHDVATAADFFRDSGWCREFRAQCRDITPENLAPRRGYAYSILDKFERRPERFERKPFSGPYRCQIQSAPNTTTGLVVELELVLYNKGGKVRGNYTFSGVRGVINGELDGTKLHFTCEDKIGTRSGNFVSSEDGGTFTGGWGSISDVSGGLWSGKRFEEGILDK